jgi:hypothetical protein
MVREIRGSEPSSWVTAQCRYCDAEFSGILAKQFVEQHVVQAHMNAITYQSPGSRTSQAEPPMQTWRLLGQQRDLQSDHEHVAETLESSSAYPNLKEQSASNINHLGAQRMFPTTKCNVCEKEYTGKYGKGNLARHVRTEHSLFSSILDQECQVCKQAYARADARRKHEWKKHRLPDAKPNKRRRET